MAKVFILIPTLKNDGAIKGAVAIANGLSQYFNVSIVVLKKIFNHQLYIDPKVEIISLGSHPFWIFKYIRYKALLKKNTGQQKPVSISVCFSADLVNLFSSQNAISFSSLRASIPYTYVSTYGWFGNILSNIHFKILKKIKRVISISNSMTRSLEEKNVNEIFTVGNFIDEKSLEKEKNRPKERNIQARELVFLGSLIKRKRVDLLIKVVSELRDEGSKIKLHLIGEGPLEQQLKNKVCGLKLENEIIFHGQQSNPYNILKCADYFILPSEAEGVSRASLEALFFGIPCILRDIDANNELIIPGKNGYLFKEDKELVDLMREIINLKNANEIQKNLIPPFFRYKNSISKLVKIINDEL